MPIRRIIREDKDQVLALDRVIFSAVDPEGGWQTSDFNQFFNEKNCYAFSKNDHPETIIGYIFATPKKDHTYISNLGTDPSAGIRGVGTALMEKVLLQEAENAKKNNRPFAVKLHVDDANENAINFYQHLGFKEDGRDRHGIKMTLDQLPEKFKKNLPPVPRQALIIRNVGGMESSDLEIALTGLDANEHAPAAFNELIKLTRTNRILEGSELNQAITLFKQEEVRDYIHKTVKENTGNYIIYHLNGLDEQGIEIHKNLNYITEKLSTIPANTDFDLMYLGGGHGDPTRGSSNLSRRQLKSITNNLHTKTTQVSAVVLGSCFSAAYLDLYQPLLKENGVMLANSLECGGNNNFLQVMEWISGQQKEFFSKEHIRNSISISEKTRTDIKGILQGTIPQGANLLTEYKQLQNDYKQSILEIMPDAAEEELNELAEQLFNRELEEFIIDAQVEIESLNKERIQEILIKHPKLNQHFKVIATKRGDEVIFATLINHLQLAPTSLVVATSNELTMFNFDLATEIPLHSAEDFQDNYQAVKEQIRQARVFSAVYEITDNFHDIAARRQFNDLFTQATDLSQSPLQQRAKENKPSVHAQKNTTVKTDMLDHKEPATQQQTPPSQGPKVTILPTNTKKATAKNVETQGREEPATQQYQEHGNQDVEKPQQPTTTQQSTAHHDTNNYNFLLNAGIALSATLAIGAFVIAALALAAVVIMPPVAIAAVIAVGAVAGLVSYGLFNTKNKEKPEEPLDNTATTTKQTGM